MTLSRFRGMLYFAARILGDVQAVRRGRVGMRIVRRLVGKGTGRLMGKWLR